MCIRDSIEAGKVGTVIVKDMSRLGRNYLQVGFYTEMLFPQKGVRLDVYKRQVYVYVRKLSSPVVKVFYCWGFLCPSGQ